VVGKFDVNVFDSFLQLSVSATFCECWYCRRSNGQEAVSTKVKKKLSVLKINK